MNETLQYRIAYLNERGRLLQNYLLPMADNELMKISPIPSRSIIIQLKNKALYFSMLLSGEIN